METRLRARWLYAGDGPPAAAPVLTIAHGRIVAIEPSGSHADLDLGPVAAGWYWPAIVANRRRALP